MMIPINLYLNVMKRNLPLILMMPAVILQAKRKIMLPLNGCMKMNSGKICLQVLTDRQSHMMKLEIRLPIETVCPLLGKKDVS